MTILIILFIVGILILGLNNDKPLLDIIGFILLIVTFSVVSVKSITNNKPCLDLPTNYKMIDSTTAIIGYFDKDSTLHIKFDNRIQFEWEGLDKDIPADGIVTVQFTTNENTVYINPVDE